MGFTVCTNTTIFKDTDPKEIEELFAYLTKIGIDGLLVSPGFSFEDNSNDVFHNRKKNFHRKFSIIFELSKKYKTMNTPMYLKFLMGERDSGVHTMGQSYEETTIGWKGPLLSDHRRIL